MSPLTKSEKDQLTRIEDRIEKVESRVNKVQNIVIGIAIGIGIAAVILGMLSLKQLIGLVK